MKFTSASASLLVVVFSLAAVVPTTGQRQQRLSVRHLQDFADETVDSMSFSGKPLALMSIAGIEGDPLLTKSKTSKSKAFKSKSKTSKPSQSPSEMPSSGPTTKAGKSGDGSG